MIDLESLPLGEVIRKAAASVPTKTAVVCEKERKTYREMNALTDALAAGIAELGIQKGDRVAIYMPNSMELVTAFYALEKLGVIVAWVNPLYRRAEAEFILKKLASPVAFLFSVSGKVTTISRASQRSGRIFLTLNSSWWPEKEGAKTYLNSKTWWRKAMGAP